MEHVKVIINGYEMPDIKSSRLQIQDGGIIFSFPRYNMTEYEMLSEFLEKIKGENLSLVISGKDPIPLKIDNNLTINEEKENGTGEITFSFPQS